MSSPRRVFNLINTNTGIIIVSIVWGLGLSCLFRKVCKGRNCIVLRPPHREKINGKVYEFEGSCYKYSPRKTKCTVGQENNSAIEI